MISESIRLRYLPMLRCTRRYGCVVGFAMLVVGSMPAVASASYFGLVQLQGLNFQGVYGTLEFHHLNTSDNTAYFANDHLYVTNSTDFQYFIEVGPTIGASQELEVASPTFEWADHRPGSQYFEHQLGADGDASYNTDYYTYILHISGGTWDVSSGGYSSQSTNNSMSGNFIFGGGETSEENEIVNSHNDPLMCESDSSLGYFDENGNGVSGWQDASHGQAIADPSNSRPPYINWYSRPTHMRTYENESSSC